MNVIIIACVLLWVATVFTQGLSVLTIGSLVSTALFCSRKIGHFCKLNSVLAIEGISLFITIAWQMLFNDIVWSRMLLSITFRLIFIGLCYYDITTYVYVKEIHRKE